MIGDKEMWCNDVLRLRGCLDTCYTIVRQQVCLWPVCQLRNKINYYVNIVIYIY